MRYQYGFYSATPKFGKLLFVGLLLLFFSPRLRAADYYFAASAQGGGNGTSCASAYAYNDGTNGWNTSGKQQPGNTLHSCGSFTFSAAANGVLTTVNNGTSSDPITLFFEPGSTWSAPYWGYAAEITNNYWTVDGNNRSGTIQATANGSALANQKAGGAAVFVSGCTGCTIKNLTIANIYVPSYNNQKNSCGTGADVIAAGCPSAGSIPDAGISEFGASPNVNLVITGNLIHDTGTGIAGGNCTDGPVTISKNTIYHTNWGVGGAPNSSFVVDGNEIYDAYVWEEPNDDNHHNGIYEFTDPCPSSSKTGIQYTNNYIHGDFGSNVTAWIFTSCQVSGAAVISSPLIANNLLVAGLSGLGGATTRPDDAFITIQADDSQIYNNTIVGITTTGSVQNAAINTGTCSGSGYGPTIKNNVISTVNAPIAINDYLTVSNNNLFYNFNVGLGWVAHCSPNPCPTLGVWQTQTGMDAQSSGSNPNLAGSYMLNAGSPAIGLGASLTSLGITLLDTGAPQAFGTNYACGAGCAARPSSGLWDAGAYSLSTSTNQGAAPTGLTATIN